MTQELLPCPFCGGTDQLRHSHVTGGIFCEECGCDGPHSPFWDGDWNTRASQWQPIETAPKDGTWFLAGRFVRGSSAAIHNNRIRADRWHDFKTDGFIGLGEFNSQHWPATHWMPLPSPPEAA